MQDWPVHLRLSTRSFLYDEEGSRLFERICDVPEYYPTRTEIAILETHIEAMREVIGKQSLLIEFGSGSSRKIRLMIDHLQPAGYVAIEISREQLLCACEEISDLYPALHITAVCADYCQPLPLLHTEHDTSARKIAFFPGSTIGNFAPEHAIHFLANVREVVGDNGGLLIGVDMKKDKERLEAAYNDKAGITAAFNLNLLHRMNRELDANFDVDKFKHRAFYNEELGRIEMHLVSRCTQQVRIKDKMFSFVEGESIHTENSYKYTVNEFQALANFAGFKGQKVWHDPNQLFSIHYFAAV